LKLKNIGAYPDSVPFLLQEEGCFLLLELLDHENSDIAIEALDILQELSSEDHREKETTIGQLL